MKHGFFTHFLARALLGKGVEKSQIANFLWGSMSR
jgi:hypothetical protein